MSILTLKNKKEEKFLRRKTAEFDFKKSSPKEIRELIKKMRETMEEANGIGLAANQIGLDVKVFVARVEGKFYAIFNPEVTKTSRETEAAVEGCLSISLVMGEVVRPYRITLKGFDKAGKKLTIRAWGHLARVLQHEVDHLNGKLFIDYLKKR